VVVLSAVEVNAGVPPELVDGEGAENNVGVVQLVIVADVRADESPGGLHGGVSAETGLLLGLAAYRTELVARVPTYQGEDGSRGSWGQGGRRKGCSSSRTGWIANEAFY